VSNESKSFEVYVTQFPQPARSWRNSRTGGLSPLWRSDGKELFFVASNNAEGYKLMAASGGALSGEAEFPAGAPQELFESIPKRRGAAQNKSASFPEGPEPLPHIGRHSRWKKQFKKRGQSQLS
jgi:hypothetical protein